MSKEFTPSEKAKLVAQHLAGKSVAALCAEYSIPRSTMYYWIQQYHPLKSTTDNAVCL
jgi:transposase-like protein